MSMLPFACLPATASLPVALGATLLTGFAIWRWWPPPGRVRPSTARLALLAGVACSLLSVFAVPLVHGSEIVMLDVGQGDAILLRTGAHAVLVDTGTNDTQVLAALARHDVRSLDAVLITHPDDDHCGSLPALLDALPVSRVCVAADLLDSGSRNCAKLRSEMADVTVEGLRAGDVLVFGAFTLDILAPESYRDEGGNADSIVARAACDADGDGQEDASALLTGDAEEEVLSELARAGRLEHADIFKVGHHGSRGAVTMGQMEEMAPKIALVSVGEGNRYGHPVQETLDTLEQGGAATYRTDEQGDVVCALSGEGIRVSTQR